MSRKLGMKISQVINSLGFDDPQLLVIQWDFEVVYRQHMEHMEEIVCMNLMRFVHKAEFIQDKIGLAELKLVF